MDFIVDGINYFLIATMLGVAGTWIWLLNSMMKSFTKTPYVDSFEIKNTQYPKVSIILPARNEEEYISKCLDSLINQDYENYEIIAIDDSSEDATGEIIKKYSKQDSKVIFVSARPKPDGWMGKNWACTEGYKKSLRRVIVIHRFRYKAFFQRHFSFRFSFAELQVGCLDGHSKNALYG